MAREQSREPELGRVHVVQNASAGKSPEALALLAKRKPAVSSKKALA